MRRSVALALATSVHAGCGFSGASTDGAIDGAIDGVMIDGLDGDGADAAVARLVVEAEDFTTNTSGSNTAWAPRTDASNFSGQAFMLLTGGNGATCSVSMNNCSHLTYEMVIVVPGDYYFQVRERSMDNSTDSIRYAIDSGVPIDLGQPTPYGVWRWELGNQFTLTTGPHTVHVWQREGGAQIDVVALTTTMSPPP